MFVFSYNIIPLVGRNYKDLFDNYKYKFVA